MGGWVVGGGDGGQLLMLSPKKLLKSKNKFTRGLAENFLSFQAKKCLGMVLDFEYQVYTRTTKRLISWFLVCNLSVFRVSMFVII